MSRIRPVRLFAMAFTLIAFTGAFVPPQSRGEYITAIPMTMSDRDAPENTTEDGFWRNLWRAVVDFFTPGQGLQIGHTTIRPVFTDFQGNAAAGASVTITFGDPTAVVETNGFTGPPFGIARATATGDILTQVTNLTANTQTLIAQISGSFEQSARSPVLSPIPIDTGLASGILTFGVDGGPALFTFQRQITNGDESGDIPPTSFTFEIPPGATTALRTTLTVGGEAMTVPEPSTFVLVSSGALSLLGYAWLRKTAAA